MDGINLARDVESLCHQRNLVTKSNLKILGFTFNVNAKIEENENMERLFRFKDLPIIESRADIVIIALQEVVELSATNVVGSAVLGV